VSLKEIKVVIADDHQFVREAISSHLERLGKEYVLIGEVSDGKELIQFFLDHNPDLLILDLEMPYISGFQILRALRESMHRCRVIVLSAHYNEFFYKELMLLGASSYLSKNCSRSEFLTAVTRVVSDGFYIVPEVNRKVIQDLIANSKLHFSLESNELTEREREILFHFSNGLLYKEIADKVCLSVNTIKFHIKSLYRKTATNSHAELIKYAIRTGLSSTTNFSHLDRLNGDRKSSDIARN
jgi:two-component system response regulator NreC